MEKGNIMKFSGDPNLCYAITENTGRKIPVRVNGIGSYLIDAQFAGGRKVEVVVDSGAKEDGRNMHGLRRNISHGTHPLPLPMRKWSTGRLKEKYGNREVNGSRAK